MARGQRYRGRQVRCRAPRKWVTAWEHPPRGSCRIGIRQRPPHNLELKAQLVRGPDQAPVPLPCKAERSGALSATNAGAAHTQN
jgi:hypothetical protein